MNFITNYRRYRYCKDISLGSLLVLADGLFMPQAIDLNRDETNQDKRSGDDYEPDQDVEYKTKH